MIAFLNGVLTDKTDSEIIVDVGGIGYCALVSKTTLDYIGLVGETIKVYTYLQVKEDGINLIGFSSLEEKNIFLKLINVSGVGPKLAITLLSGISAQNLVVAILKSDIDQISAIKGVGKKTAERICLELKDKFEIIGTASTDKQNISTTSSVAIEESIQTLISLGLSKNEAKSTINEVFTPGDSADELIAKALKGMGH